MNRRSLSIALIGSGRSGVMTVGDMLLAAAVEGQADALVTNDAEVLKVGAYRGVHILRPSDFASRLANSSSGFSPHSPV